MLLCPWDVEESDFGDDGGLPAAAVRLDETVQIPGEILSYVYDYGDNWELALRLENVLSAAAGTPSAVAVGGRRAAPPEECGGRRTADELAEVLEDPSLFDPDEVNGASATERRAAPQQQLELLAGGVVALRASRRIRRSDMRGTATCLATPTYQPPRSTPAPTREAKRKAIESAYQSLTPKYPLQTGPPTKISSNGSTRLPITPRVMWPEPARTTPASSGNTPAGHITQPSTQCRLREIPRNRHTHASLALMAVPVKVISERLEHESAAFTPKQYAHVLRGMQAEAAPVVTQLVASGAA